MKKKILSMLIALTMVLSMTVNAFAWGTRTMDDDTILTDWQQMMDTTCETKWNSAGQTMLEWIELYKSRGDMWSEIHIKYLMLKWRDSCLTGPMPVFADDDEVAVRHPDGSDWYSSICPCRGAEMSCLRCEHFYDPDRGFYVTTRGYLDYHINTNFRNIVCCEVRYRRRDSCYCEVVPAAPVCDSCGVWFNCDSCGEWCLCCDEGGCEFCSTSNRVERHRARNTGVLFLSAEVFTVQDALAILRYTVGLPSILDICPDAYAAALIVSEDTPGVRDALQILRSVVGLSSVLD
jgi:hypothetical protein